MAKRGSASNGWKCMHLRYIKILGLRMNYFGSQGKPGAFTRRSNNTPSKQLLIHLSLIYYIQNTIFQNQMEPIDVSLSLSFFFSFLSLSHTHTQKPPPYHHPFIISPSVSMNRNTWLHVKIHLIQGWEWERERITTVSPSVSQPSSSKGNMAIICVSYNSTWIKDISWGTKCVYNYFNKI